MTPATRVPSSAVFVIRLSATDTLYGIGRQFWIKQWICFCHSDISENATSYFSPYETSHIQYVRLQTSSASVFFYCSLSLQPLLQTNADQSVFMHFCFAADLTHTKTCTVAFRKNKHLVFSVSTNNRRTDFSLTKPNKVVIVPEPNQDRFKLPTSILHLLICSDVTCYK